MTPALCYFRFACNDSGGSNCFWRRGRHDSCHSCCHSEEVRPLLVHYIHCNGGSRISQRWAPSSKGLHQPIYCITLSEKLHENEENWTAKGAHVQNFTMYIRHCITISVSAISFSILKKNGKKFLTLTETH